jgi:hypothetical protein
VVYDYAQSIEEVLVEAQLPAHIQQQDVSVRFDPSSLLVVVGQQRVIEGRLAGHIMPQRSSWKIGEPLLLLVERVVESAAWLPSTAVALRCLSGCRL